MQKMFVLDSNILLSYPDAILGFDNNLVMIPSMVLQELDRMKGESGETGHGAREACRILEELRQKGNLAEGVETEQGGRVRIVNTEMYRKCPIRLPEEYSRKTTDNQIIELVLQMMQQEDAPVILVTNDISMRINASSLGLTVQEYKNARVHQDEYRGYRTVVEDPALLQELYKNGKVPYENAIQNEFLIVSDGGNGSALAVFRGEELRLIRPDERRFHPFGIGLKNAVQKFAMWALTASAEEIPLVVLDGPAGVGKTFLAEAAGLSGTYDSKRDRSYRRMMITRSNSKTEDKDFGYLPGDLKEKMEPLLAPFYDNLETLLRAGTPEDDTQITVQIEELFITNTITLAPLAYIRGRSIVDSYIICDEFQNVSQRMAKDILTRVGSGSKLVVMGDSTQIDNYTLDEYNNGLTYVLNRMKGSPMCAIIRFSEEESVRSPLAREALRRLT